MSKSDEYFEKLIDETQSYVDNKITYTKLVFTEKTAKVTSLLSVYLVLFFIGFMVVVFGSFMLGYLFSEYFNSFFYGFGMLVGIYVLLFLIFLLIIKDKLIKKMSNMIVRMLLNDD